MKKTTLIIGGSRSGKSRHALEMAELISGSRRIFIATCVPHDTEMKERVARHKAERSLGWTTLEIPIALPEAVAEYSPKADVILIDCLTLWISNLLMENDDSQILEDHLENLSGALGQAQCQVILVSNEVGTGIVPENRLARRFRDLAGFVNQRIAECGETVIWMVAGIPVVIKNQGDGVCGYINEG